VVKFLKDKSAMHIRVTGFITFLKIFFWFYFVSIYMWLHVWYAPVQFVYASV
jgi:hypothetical protein